MPYAIAYDPSFGAIDDADRERMYRLNERRLTNAQLEAWYERLGFERTGEMEGDSHVMKRMPRPLVLYHSAPFSARDSITSNGLLSSMSETAQVADDMEEGGGVFLSLVPEDARARVVDVWEVSANGLELWPDETTDCPRSDDSWWVVWGDIPAARLELAPLEMSPAI